MIDFDSLFLRSLAYLMSPSRTIIPCEPLNISNICYDHTNDHLLLPISCYLFLLAGVLAHTRKVMIPPSTPSIRLPLFHQTRSHSAFLHGVQSDLSASARRFFFDEDMEKWGGWPFSDFLRIFLASLLRFAKGALGGIQCCGFLYREVTRSRWEKSDVCNY